VEQAGGCLFEGIIWGVPEENKEVPQVG